MLISMPQLISLSLGAFQVIRCILPSGPLFSEVAFGRRETISLRLDPSFQSVADYFGLCQQTLHAFRQP